MQKVSSKKITIPAVLAVIALTLCLSCGRGKEKENNTFFFNNNLKTIIDTFPAEPDTTIIYMVFYEIEDKQYLKLQEMPQYDPFRNKGYYRYKNLILAYTGLDDTLAGKFINLDLLNLDKQDTSSFKKEIWDWDVGPYEYKITGKGSFIPFKPDTIHSDILYEMFLEKGIVRLPPPPPPL